MRDVNIDGIGSVISGEYQKIYINGMGKIKGRVSAVSVDVDGTLKVKAPLSADDLRIDGVARVFRNIKAKHVNFDGLIKLRRASVSSDSINGSCIISCNREINADEFIFNGRCSIKRLCGDRIRITDNHSLINKGNFAITFNLFAKIYLGRIFDYNHSIVDYVECTDIEADGIKMKVLRADRVVLRNHCVVNELHCDGTMDIDDTCIVKKITGRGVKAGAEIKDSEIIFDEPDRSDTLNYKIYMLYKNGNLSAEEAKKMRDSMETGNDALPSSEATDGLQEGSSSQKNDISE